MLTDVFIGCAGWSLHKDLRIEEKIHYLQQYSKFFNCVEINTSFYRDHRPSTYATWADLVPKEFRFSIKIPKIISHETGLQKPELIDPLLEGVKMLGSKAGPLLLQTPPKLEFDPIVIIKFFDYLSSRFSGQVVYEPRHDSWVSDNALKTLEQYNLSLVAADPDKLNRKFEVQNFRYQRLHGSPKIYYSSYSEEFLSSLAAKILKEKNSKTWVIFDNTALGFAYPNAMQLNGLLS